MAYKLAVGEFIEFPVTLEFNDAGTARKFGFRLVAKRIPEAQVNKHTDDMLNHAATAESRVDKTVAMLQAYVTGWRDQRLVLDDEGNPAPFGPDAFAAMLALPGAAVEISRAFNEANRARGKPGN